MRLLVAPPGHTARIIRPTAMTGLSRNKVFASSNATSDSARICKLTHKSVARGFSSNRLKSSVNNVRPRPNMMRNNDAGKNTALTIFDSINPPGAPASLSLSDNSRLRRSYSDYSGLRPRTVMTRGWRRLYSDNSGLRPRTVTTRGFAASLLYRRYPLRLTLTVLSKVIRIKQTERQRSLYDARSASHH